MVKNLPAMRETQVGSLGSEDPLEEGMATHSSTLAWRIPMHRGAWQATGHGVAKSQTWLSTAQCIKMVRFHSEIKSPSSLLPETLDHPATLGRTTPGGSPPHPAMLSWFVIKFSSLPDLTPGGQPLIHDLKGRHRIQLSEAGTWGSPGQGTSEVEGMGSSGCCPTPD